MKQKLTTILETNEENGDYDVLFEKYKNHICNLFPISDEMLDYIPKMGDGQIRELLTLYDKNIQCYLREIVMIDFKPYSI